MFNDKKNFLIATNIIKKHLSYLKRKGIKIEIKQKNGQIAYEIDAKNKKNKESLEKNASRLMDFLINLDANI